MCFPDAVDRDPAVEAWFRDFPEPLRLLVLPWFERMRSRGSDVRELIHDGCPVACAGEAAFGYVTPSGRTPRSASSRARRCPTRLELLEGTGKRMRHVKIRPGVPSDEGALEDLVGAAYSDMRQRIIAR